MCFNLKIDSRCAVSLLLNICCNQAHSPAARDFPVAGTHTTLTRRPPSIAAEKIAPVFTAMDAETIPASATASTHFVVRRAEAELESVRESSAALPPRIPSAGLRRQQLRLQPQPPGTRGGSCRRSRRHSNISIAAVAAAAVARTDPPLSQRASCAGPQITGELRGVQKDASYNFSYRFFVQACLLLEVLFLSGLGALSMKIIMKKFLKNAPEPCQYQRALSVHTRGVNTSALEHARGESAV